MATSRRGKVLQHLRQAVLLREGADVADEQLLQCFVTDRDEAAFAALVRRHGPMVWGVCQRVLGNHHDAEDAFQATFLVLVRKAASITSRELLPSWLYGVAYRTALKAKALAARQRSREKQVMELPEPEVARQEVWSDLQPLLDHELSRLSDPYRAVILLCDLEGKTRKEAAQELGVPEGTVAGRLARARDGKGQKPPLSDEREQLEKQLRKARAGLEQARKEKEALKKQLGQAKAELKRAQAAKDSEEKLVLQVYPVADLVDPEAASKETEAAALIRVITKTIDPTSWDLTGGPGSVEYFPLTKTLVISHSTDKQQRVRHLLETLQKIRAHQEKPRK